MYYKYLFTILLSASSLYSSINYYYSNSKKVYLSPIKKEEITKSPALNMHKNIVYYKTDRGNILGVGDSIIVKFHNLAEYENITKKYSLREIKEIYLGVYLFELEDIENILLICDELYNDENIVYAHPNFIKSIEKR